MQNKDGGKMYIQNKMEEYADQLFDLLDNGAHIYFCGLKGAARAPPCLHAHAVHACHNRKTLRWEAIAMLTLSALVPLWPERPAMGIQMRRST